MVPPLHAPSPEDLFGILRMCGSEEQVVRFLARTYEVAPEIIAPTVRGWLKELPPVPPPSRQRSAPPLLEPAAAATASCVCGAQPANFGTGAPDRLRIKTPPASAPIRGSASEVVAAMRALDTRLNHSTRANGAAREPPGKRAQQLRLRNDATVLGVPASVPEDAVLAAGHDRADETQQAAYTAYMARAALGGRLEPSCGRGRDPVPSTWMTRARNVPGM